MELITSLFSGGWGWIAGVFALVAGLAASYFGGKKIGAVQTQAKADVKAAEQKVTDVKASSDAQLKVTKEASNVQDTVSRISDNDVDKQLRSKWTRPGSGGN